MAGIRYKPNGESDSSGSGSGSAPAPPAAESSRRISRRRRHLQLMGALIVTSDDVGGSSDNETKTDTQPEQETITIMETNQTQVQTGNLVTNLVEMNPNVQIGNEVDIYRQRFGVTSICGRRRSMEDAISLHPNLCNKSGEAIHFYGLYDGHGCSHVSERCKTRLHWMVKREVDSSSVVDWPETLGKCFNMMDRDVSHWADGVRSNADFNRSQVCPCMLEFPDRVGSTAVVSVVTSDQIIVSNCGDSRAILCRNGVPIPLSSDHKADRPDEVQRVEEAGGHVVYWQGPRVLGVLAMSRAIGDNYLKPYVIPDPEVIVQDRTGEDECLILASDGLWDVVSNEVACRVALTCLNEQSQQQQTKKGYDRACAVASMLLTKLALGRLTLDNVSVVVVDLRRNRYI